MCRSFPSGRFACLDDDCVGADGLQACAEPDLDAALLQKPVREGRKRFRHLRQDTLTALKQYQAEVVFRYVVVSVHGLAQKVVHFRDAFDARESAARDDECQQALANFGIAFRLRLFQHTDELIAEIQCVTEILERTRMLAHPWNFRIVETRPHGDHEMVVA